mmetsp:Transcript_13030/g.20222  ORF Transcript_13030/g.20222 Transcript_13030/m.20222 type:complete len:185 (-) Transcript_13030:1420-1974(-)
MRKFDISLILLIGYASVATACQACLFSIPFLNGNNRHYSGHNHIVRNKSHLGSKLVPFGVLAVRHIVRNNARILREEADEAKELSDEDFSEDADQDDTVVEEPPISKAAIGAIQFYKGFISPLLPPACRFFPTCSQYGVQAIQEYGASRGVILIAWRLLRCSPFGGKGYDPPKWPPVPYNYASY